MDVSIIIERNPWRKNPEAIKDDEKVKDALSRKHRILYSFERDENLIFIGPRRAGKTTYFKLLIYDLLINKRVNPEDVLYVSCEILKDSSDILDVLRLISAKYVFLDEITFAEGWEKAIKFAIDQGILKGRILYITGSSTAFLKKETFPGRKIKFVHFTPMDFLKFARIFGSEPLKEALEKGGDMEDLMLHFQEIFGLFRKYMECGGFPKPAFQLMEEGGIRQENYDEIYSWFRGDMLKLGRSEEISKALISRLLETSTTLIAYNSIGNYIGVSQRIVREYIEEMKNLMYADFCYQIDLGKNLPIFRKEKKVYFTDPFIVKAFEKKILGKEIVNESKLAEMIVFNSLKAVNENVYVIKTDESETDFFAGGDRIEVKWSEKIEPRKGTIVLGKKEYNPKKSFFPLMIFILHYLKNKGKTVKSF